MAFNSYFGSFQMSTSAAPTTQTIAGVGFTPKVVIFWWGFSTATIDTVGRKDVKKGFGFMTDAGENGCGDAFSDDAALTANSHSITTTTRCIHALGSAGGSLGQADFNAVNGDGFVLDIAGTFVFAFTVFFIALGGDDLTNYDIGTFTEHTGAGTQDITSVGFRPDTAIILGSASTTLATATGDSLHSIGFAANTTPSTFVVSGGSNNTPTTMQTLSYAKGAEIIALYDAGVTALDSRADLTAWLDTGFTLTWSESANRSRELVYLAMKGPKFTVGTGLTQTDTTTDIVASSFGFTPSAFIIGSAARAASTADTPTDHDHLSIGGGISSSSRGAVARLDEDNLGTSQTTEAIEFDEVYVNIDTASAIQGLMDIKSVDTDGLTFIMDNADPAQSFFGYWSVGLTPVAGTAIKDIIGGGMILYPR